MSHAKQLHNRRYLNDYLEIINREGLPGNVKNDVCRKVQAAVIATVQHVIEAALDEELSAYLGVDRYEHVPWGRPPETTRSGSYQRTLLTPYGAIADLHVPKLRRGNGALAWQNIMRYECCWGPLLDHQVMSYCLGHSLRDLQETLALTLGEVLSLAACNRMVSRVTEQLAVCKMQALESPPPVLLVDGMLDQDSLYRGRGPPRCPGPSSLRQAQAEAGGPERAGRVARWALGNRALEGRGGRTGGHLESVLWRTLPQGHHRGHYGFGGQRRRQRLGGCSGSSSLWRGPPTLYLP